VARKTVGHLLDAPKVSRFFQKQARSFSSTLISAQYFITAVKTRAKSAWDVSLAIPRPQQNANQSEETIACPVGDELVAAGDNANDLCPRMLIAFTA
jgi:hypothetical protein